MSLRNPLLGLLPLLALSCDHAEPPLGPEAAEPTPLLSVVDATAPGGLPGFYFRPPIVPGPPASVGDFDASLLDLLVVEVCEWNGEACMLPLIRRITSDDRPPEGLRLNKSGEFYRAVWDTGRDELDPEKTYRVRVLASGGELGHADVDVVEAAGEEWNPHGAEMVRLVKGDGLPIVFRIEEGLGVRTGPGDRTVTLAEGGVTLELPEGALTEDVFLTATPVEIPPGSPPAVPGTAWDLCPDGLGFGVPVWLTIPYDPDLLPEGTEERELRIHKIVDGEFVQQDAGLVDLLNKTVSAEVDGFSVVVVIPRDPDSPEDILPPEVRSIEVLDPVSGTFGDAVPLELSAADANLTLRIWITDGGTGVGRIFVEWMSPSERQRRFICATEAPPDIGFDTNGHWDCEVTFPQYAEAGLWQPAWVAVWDKVGNRINYRTGPGGFCDITGTQCISEIPQITVVSDQQDIIPPVLHSLEVSPDIEPRVFGPSVTVDASTGPRRVFFRFEATDEPSGVSSEFSDRGFAWELMGPSNQRLSQSTRVACTLEQGDPEDGTFECRLTIAQHAEAGTWNFTRLYVPDRAGNEAEFTPNGLGQLCTEDGNCVTAPTVEVVSLGDGEPPTLLPPLGIAATGSDVVTTMRIRDLLSGVRYVSVTYFSTTTTQRQGCFASLTEDTRLEGTWACTISFPELAASGQWVPSISVSDVAGNNRYYSRRASDGFLCYNDPVTGQVCQDFGDTDIILE